VHAIVNLRASLIDKNAKALYGERVPYVIVYSHADAGMSNNGPTPKIPRLMDLVADPRQLLVPCSTLRLNGFYYLDKQILPSLSRVLNAAGLDPRRWFDEMKRPRPPKLIPQRTSHNILLGYGWGNEYDTPNLSGSSISGMKLTGPKQRMLTSYLLNDHCVFCDIRCKSEVCDNCRQASSSYTVALGKLSYLQDSMSKVMSLCQGCLHTNNGHPWQSGVEESTLPAPGQQSFPLSVAACSSMDCPVLYKRVGLQENICSAMSLCEALGLMP
jgi:hypothetical protein